MSKCSKCHKEFECCANTDKACWCNDVHLTKEQLAYLNKTYDKCLCPDCLKEMEKSTEDSIGGIQ